MKRRLIAVLAVASCTAPLRADPPPLVFDLNQLGFLPDSPKRAVFPHMSAEPVKWSVIDATSAVVLSGETQPRPKDAALGYHPHVIDLSALRTPGKGYRLAAGNSTSNPFAISADLYRPLAHDALSYFYHNRAGTPILARFAGGERWARPAGHPEERVTCFAGEDNRGNRWPGCGYTLDVTGGWYDAGDHGKYVVNGGIALWTLLNLHELRQARGGAPVFADGSHPIPEAGNGVSDLLDEARWEMEFLLAMQVPEGARLRVPVGQKTNQRPLVFTDIDGGGMAHHKIADERWTGLPMRPDRDPETRYLYAPSTAATLNLAATAAQCARIWRGIDAAFSARCLEAARRAWAAAERNAQVYAVGDFNGSGGYGDSDVSDEFFWAAAELFATTGEAVFEKALRASPHFAAPVDKEPGWPSVAPLGKITLALIANSQPQKQALIDAADRWSAEARATTYGIPYASDRYAWGSNSNLLNRAIILALAAHWTGEARYRGHVIDVMDYLLGRNPLGRSFVSGYGARPMRNPHHRFWAHQIDPAYPPPPPGALSGGPNNTSSPRSDEPVAPPKGCAPQTCWVDDARSFTTNEVAINWNAPLVWVATWLATSPSASRSSASPSQAPPKS
ncbi:glycoside hydrolase family 9 protein [Sphingomonas gilva]|nr:glycoside hydrolase family 9 protein [Sphingomonas gilva]